LRDEELGRHLLEGKAITAEALKGAMEEAKRRRCTLEALLKEQGMVREQELCMAIGKTLGIPCIDLEDMRVDREAARLLPEHLARRYRALPVKVTEGEILLAMADPSNVVAFDDIRFITGSPARPAVAAESAIERYLQWAYDEETLSTSPVMKAPPPPRQEAVSPERLIEMVDEAPIVRVVNLVISQAINDQAAEILMQPSEKELTVFYIIDDELREVMHIPVHVREAVTGRIKIMATMDPFDTRTPQKGRIQLSHDRKRKTVIVSTEPGEWGEKVTLALE